MLFDYNFKHYNFRLVLYVLILNAIGVLVIRSAAANMPDAANIVTKQIIGIMAGMTIAIILSLIDYHRIVSFSSVIYALCILSLLAVLALGVKRGGAQRWIIVPGLGQLQPSEFVKIGLIVFFSWYFGKYQEKLNSFSTVIIAVLLFAVPVFLILEQPNLSTSIIIIATFLIMFYIAGLSYKWIFGTVAVAAPVGAVFILLLKNGMIPFLRDYQARRILAFVFGGDEYAQDQLQQLNSVIAIGSGQLYGKGLNTTTVASVKNGNFLSEEQTDFIFAVIGEELGFIGCVVVIILFLLVVYECLLMAARAKDATGKLICAGMGTLIAVQSFANIAVATMIFPNTGLPLPFISSGVSSLLSISLGIGVALNVGLQRKSNH